LLSIQTGAWKGAVSYKVEQVFNCPRHGGDGNSAGLFRLEDGKELFRTKWSRYLIVSDTAEMETVLVCSDWRMERSCFVQSGAGI
jgi:hypothetical protein